MTRNSKSPLGPEWWRVALESIGDAVITTDERGRITFLNPIAESLTGWSAKAASGLPLEDVFRVVNQDGRAPSENPGVRALRDGVIVGLANHSVLIARDGSEHTIEDSAAPIRNALDEVAGVVLVFRDKTERDLRERALQDALAYADDIIETLREPFLVLDPELRVVRANRSFFQDFRVTPAETIGRFVYDLGDQQWRIPKLQTLLADVLPQHRRIENFEVEHEFPHLGRRIMALNARPFPESIGRAELILLAIEDVSDRRAQLRSVQESEDRFRRLLETLPAAAYTCDSDGLIMFFNQSASALWGREPKLNHPDDRFCGSLRLYATDGAPMRHEQSWMALTLRDGVEHIGEELLCEGVDGVRRVLLAHCSPFFDALGRVCGAVNVLVDITDRRRAEQVLEESELRYRRLFQTAKDGILILDADTLEIIDVNPFMSELLGYGFDEFVGKELWEIGVFEDKEASQVAYRTLQETGYIRYEHLPLETKSGEQVEVEFVSNIYPLEGTRVAQCNIRDISERSRLERKTLEQAAVLADQDRRKDEFLAMLGHELRNPLAPILNALQLLRGQTGEGQVQKRARTIIERQVGQLTHLVDDLLEVSRITTGKIHLQRERLLLADVVANAVETVRPLIQQRGHTLEISLAPESIWLFADASRLEQVVVNLLTNAAKYMADHGRIWLAIAQDRDEAVLSVRDSGVGIAPKLLPRIFDLFSQAERSIDRSEGGMGIGLSLVQSLVEMHDGRVDVQSALGVGSEFVVRLPVMAGPSETLQANGAAVASIAKSCRVLVVDDNVDAAESLVLLLRLARHQARMVHDGPSALAAALEFRPEVVLLDIGLPGMSGLEVAKRLREQVGSLGNIVLVALTGYGQEADRQRSREAGFDHHLVKPAAFAKVEEILVAVKSVPPG